MRIAGRRFAPSIFATVLLALGLAAFIRLGFWQLGRADEKQSLIQRYDAGQLTTLDLTSANVNSIVQYQHVRARGRYDGEHQILLDNMPSAQGRPGYRVLTPFELDAGGVLLVDRGWIAMGATREARPHVDVDTEPRDISGRYDALPRAGIALDAEGQRAEGPWPRVLNFPQHAAIEAVLGRTILPGVVLLDAAEPNGYERAWQARFQFGPERHVGYAVQWFGLATAALVIFLIVSFRPEHNVHE